MSSTEAKLFDIKMDRKTAGDEGTQEKRNSKGCDDGQKQFFRDEYRREGEFLINHKAAESENNEEELKTSVTKNDLNVN